MTSTALLARLSPRVLLALLLLAATLNRAAAAQGQYHVLAKGETLYSVARQYGLKPDVIAKANAIDDPSRLKAGTRLLIPESTDSSSVGGSSTGDSARTGIAVTASSAVTGAAVSTPATITWHKVVKGDTLFSIARSYGIELSELKSANKLGASSKIKPGDNLKIPGAASATSSIMSSGSAGTASTAGTASSVPPGAPVEPKAQAGEGPIKPMDPLMPDPVKTSVKSVKRNISWPCPGEILYLEGKAYGVIIKSRLGEVQRAVSAGTVSSAGAYRGYGNVVFILSRTGHIYVYGGNEKLSVRAGDRITVGQELGKVGMDLKQGGPAAYFLVFKNGAAVDPALAPRD